MGEMAETQMGELLDRTLGGLSPSRVRSMSWGLKEYELMYLKSA